MVSRSDKKQNKKKRKWLRWVVGIVVGLFLLIGGFVFYLWNEVGATIETMHNPLARDEDPDRQKQIDSIFSNKDSLNALLLGVDERSGDKGRSDTMILMSINPKTNEIIMLSIPRDTYVNIPGRGMDKINHAYAFGGVDLSVQTVEEAFNLPVHVYARVNMEGFQQGIDALGGVTVNNSLAFSSGGHTFPEGQISLNGEEALDYIRMRYEDPRGDMGRNERQRNVIAAAMNEAASFSSITKVGEILTILGDNVQTDLDMKKIQTLFTDYAGARRSITTMEINGSGQTIGGVWYYMVPDEEFSRITSDITAHMEAK
ncbi:MULTISPECIES: LCP family glycopolymer transferase [Oceanobacillus]|uniref:Polyisoprenyl-teichoic acid--peptidoglycan teichoic acid transferase TagU n=1 Tax=Oceanobacillus profundus TaxID=372463 RepID=A0A417Y9N4_9BACI|nr:LCP family protein [Oceanobacillus profundus]MBR3117938.1 LCP family protein [Oceanobacillus sp.]MCM3397325.1 LCP family protein [Oceanobacillus profundus]PAE28554.1 transcriptional regulator LytR [Paenibacillus sp. 7884-2]RHW29398.1 transcriptional regulator LytR [Oceanobacillus profundus]